MVAYYNEIDEKAAAWLRELIAKGLIADGVVDTRSIEDVEPRQLAGFTQCHFFAGIGVWSYALRQAGVSDDTPVWTGSCPCQPFSAAGKGGGFDDERHLWPAWQWLIQQRRPELIIGEQVASKDAEPWLDLVQADLEGLDYAFGACAFPSAGVGAPHIRDRTYWVADNKIGGRREERSHAGRKPVGDGAQGDAAGPEHGRRAGRLANNNKGLEGRGQSGRERGDEFAAGPGGLARGLANSDGSRHLSGALGGIHSGEDGAGPRHGEPERSSADGGMADASIFGRERGRAGEAGGAPGAVERPDGFRDVIGLADADGGNASAEWEQPGGQQRQQPQDGRTSVMADASIFGRERGRSGQESDASGSIKRPDGLRDAGGLGGPAGADGAGAQGEHGLREVATHAGPVNGGWGNADWIYCRNGEWRPVEPGTFPLAHGAPARVGRLRGFGNAINAEAATVFIQSYLEARS